MSTDYSDPYELYERYGHYEENFSPLQNDRQARRKRKPKVRHIRKKSHDTIIDEMVDDTLGLEGGFQTTYQPSRHEEGWLLESIRDFYERALITDVLAVVKGGKEANVYRCQAHDSTGASLLAAKVYRPRMFRNLRNDAMYREGRDLLQTEESNLKGRDYWKLRHVSKDSDFGELVQHTSWLMHEYAALEKLHAVGADVPQPYAVTPNAILMSYHGDESIAAPTLNQMRLEPDEASMLFRRVLKNIRLMLKFDLIHGDLSAYNILYWEGQITLIDFPQVVEAHVNSNARLILERDIQRVCEYFTAQGVEADPDTITGSLWYGYIGQRDDDLAADASRVFWDEED